MWNPILLFVLLVLVASGSGKEEPKKARYCGRHAGRIMTIICRNSVQQSGALQKRSFYSLAGKQAQHDLWRRIFNIDENTKLTIPEVSFQMNLLFGQCNDYQKQTDLKSLLETYRNREYKRNLNREYTNDRLTNGNEERSGNYLNYEPSNEESLKELAFNPLLRFRRGIYEECCLKTCTISQMKAYCHSADSPDNDSE